RRPWLHVGAPGAAVRVRAAGVSLVPASRALLITTGRSWVSLNEVARAPLTIKRFRLTHDPPEWVIDQVKNGR
ncbi:MAG: hypothetical protein WD151_03310, partial [Phycisphaeraceae bacterium]